MRKAAVSIPSNIAEGRGRHSIPDYRHFLHQARGSTHEIETQIELARRLKFTTDEIAEKLIDLAHQTGKLINGLLGSLPDA